MAKTKTATKAKTVTKKPEDLTRRLKAVIKQEAETWVEFAQVAYEIYNTEHWRKKGYENLKEYVQKETEGKVSYEIFMHRVKMGEAIKKHKLTKREIVSIGWTKFKEIATLALSDESMAREEVLEMVEEAKDMSYRDVQAFVRKERLKKANAQETKTVTLKFKLIDEQDNVVKEALDLAMQMAETDQPSIGLTYMATEFIMHHSEDSDVVEAIREQVKKVSEAKEAKAPHKPHANKGKKKNGKKKTKQQEETKEEEQLTLDDLLE